MTTRCHSVRSLRSPELRSRQLSDVATERLAIRVPSWVERISGSRPRLPTRITLLTLPAMLSVLEPCDVGSAMSTTPTRKGGSKPIEHLMNERKGDHGAERAIQLA